MKNQLLEIGLEHYVIILMWIPLLIHDVVLKQSKGFKLFVIAAFFFPWISIIAQAVLKVAYMICNGSPNYYIFAKFWRCLCPTIDEPIVIISIKIFFNILHLVLLCVLLYVAMKIVMKKLYDPE